VELKCGNIPISNSNSTVYNGTTITWDLSTRTLTFDRPAKSLQALSENAGWESVMSTVPVTTSQGVASRQWADTVFVPEVAPYKSEVTDESSGTTGLFRKKYFERFMPEGGTTGQILIKVSGNDYDVEWTDTYIDQLWYGIEFDNNVSASACTRIGNMDLHRSLPIQRRLKGCLLDATGDVVEYLNPTSWLGNDRSGARGNVMVEIPRHYEKFETEGTIRRAKISEYALPGFHLVEKQYISAYEATVDRTNSSLIKLASVVNTDPIYRGGNNNAAWDGTYRDLCGLPVTLLTRPNFTTYARNINAGDVRWNQYLYEANKTLAWLYYIEYADRNSQLPFNAQKDGNGFRQGGLGNGVTTIASADWNTYNGYYPFIPCGYTDSLGNESGEIAFNLPDEFPGSVRTVYVNRYHGVENPFGHLWKWTEGINVEIKSDADGGTSKVYVCPNPALFSATGYTGYEMRGLEARGQNYTKEMIIGEFGDLIPSVVGGGSTTYWADYHYTNIPGAGTVLRGVLVSASASNGATAGFGIVYSSNAPSATTTAVSGRLCFSPTP